MRTIDLTPLYRTVVGFDRMANLIETASRLDAAPGWPPYNIEQVHDDAYRIEIAVAGFTPDDIAIELKEGVLHVAARKPSVEEARRFLHRGIAERSFERRFQLADHVQVTGASLEHGLLTIELVREVPEALKPRKIEIGSGRKLTAVPSASASEAA